MSGVPIRDMCVESLKNDSSTLNSICHHRLVVRTGRCGRPDGGSILPGDIFLTLNVKCCCV